jgi:hypothetical protein
MKIAMFWAVSPQEASFRFRIRRPLTDFVAKFSETEKA